MLTEAPGAAVEGLDRLVEEEAPESRERTEEKGRREWEP
jgi:hypothetical protein